jgi:transposase-like protein
MVTIFKCSTDTCPHRKKKLAHLKASEKMMQKMIPTHFKLNYQYREYHFKPEHIFHSAPEQIQHDIFKIYNSENVLGLVLSLYISFALSARKTALMLDQVFNINVSHQTVLNYARSAAYYAHQFNLKHKGSVDDMLVGDETYIKIEGKYNYVWFILSSEKRSIVAYHLDASRGTQAAVAAISESVKTASSNQKLTVISDANPSYTEAIHFLNKDRPKNPIKHIKVIGLQNMDETSEEYRPFKQIIERFNRSYKQHVKPAAGFNSFNGAMALTALFVTHYNFLRGHTALNFKPPINIPELDHIRSIQGKWVHLIKMML